MTTSAVLTTRPSASLDGRTALVTGSTSGIGEAIARALAADGAHVIVSGRDVARGTTVTEDIRAGGGHADFVRVDLGGEHGDVRSFATKATATLGGRVDILVNNAGIYPANTTADLPDDALDALLAVNVRAPHILVAELAPPMAQRGSGAIINIGSWMARIGSPIAAMYTATKAANEQLTRSWAAEYGPSGVRVNTVAPGATSTPGTSGARDMLAALARSTPAGAPVQPEDVAEAVSFLVSDRASLIHGVTLDVDGGLSTTRLS